MRVLHIAWEYPPHVIGGLGRHVVELTDALAAGGHEIAILTPLMRGGPPAERIAPGIEVRRPVPPMMEEYEFFSFVNHTAPHLGRAAIGLWADMGRFDLIHAHDWLGATAGVALKHHWRIPLLATIHATERGRGRGALIGRNAHQINELEWRLTYEAWRVIVCSHAMARELQDYFRLPVDKIDMVPNGVGIPPDPFCDMGERTAFRRRYAADHQALVYYVGRIVYEKGLHVLVEAWQRIRQYSDACLVIAGIGSYLDQLKELVAARGYDGQIIFAGFISDEEREKLYRVADAAVFPSLYEPFGIVALEAFAAGCPVIASNTGGLGEVVQNGATGLLAPPGDPDTLAVAVIETLTRRQAARARAAAALELVQSRYDWHRIAAETVEIYQRVLKEWQAGSWGREQPILP